MGNYFADYDTGGFFDEMFRAPGEVRPHYQQILERMVYDLEPQAADGSLSPANKLVFAHAKQQIEALKTLPDSRPDRLARVARIIDSYDERFPSHSEIPQDRRTLN